MITFAPFDTSILIGMKYYATQLSLKAMLWPNVLPKTTLRLNRSTKAISFMI